MGARSPPAATEQGRVAAPRELVKAADPAFRAGGPSSASFRAAGGARRRAVRELWGLPVTELWFVDGSDYLGTVIIRHRLTPALTRAHYLLATSPDGP